MNPDTAVDDVDGGGPDGSGVFTGLLFGALVWLIILLPLAF